MSKTTDKRRASFQVETVRAESGEAENRVIRFIASTTGVARDGGIVESWDLSHYTRNPVVLWSHNPDVPPIAKALRAEMTARGLEIDAEFAGAGETKEHRLADIVFKLYRTGFLRSVSVGFRVVDEREPNDKEREAGARWVCRGELFELSAVAVPADPGAVAVDRELIARTFTTSDVSVVRTQFGAIEPWQPILHSLESAVAESAGTVVEPAVCPIPLQVREGTTTLAQLQDTLLRCEDLLQECAGLLAEMHAHEETPRSEPNSEERKVSQGPPASPAVEAVSAKALDAASEGRDARLLDLLKKHYPHA